MIPRALFFIPLALPLAALGAPARADEAKATPTQVVQNAAADWLARGNEAFKTGDFIEAERAYREAFALKPGYDIAGNLGAAEMAQGKIRQAAEHLAFTLRLFPLTGEPDLRERITRALEQCRRGLAIVRVEVHPEGARVAVDGAPLGPSAFLDEVYLDPGDHTFTASLRGYTGAPKRLHVEAGGSTQVELTLSPIPTAKPRPAPPRPRSALPGLALGAASAAGFAAGATFLALAASRRAGADALRTEILHTAGSCVPGAANHDPRCSTLAANLGAHDTFHDLALGAFVTGGVAAAGAAAFFLWPTGRPVRVTPLFGGTGGAVMVTGAF